MIESSISPMMTGAQLVNDICTERCSLLPRGVYITSPSLCALKNTSSLTLLICAPVNHANRAWAHSWSMTPGNVRYSRIVMTALCVNIFLRSLYSTRSIRSERIPISMTEMQVSVVTIPLMSSVLYGSPTSTSSSKAWNRISSNCIVYPSDFGIDGMLAAMRRFVSFCISTPNAEHTS